MQAACVAALTVSVMLSGDRMDVSAQNTAESVQESYTEEELELQTLNEEEDNTEPEVISEEMVEENDRDITENFPEGSESVTEIESEEVTEEILDQNEEMESEQELILEPEYQILARSRAAEDVLASLSSLI